MPRQAGSGAGPLCLHLPRGGRGVSCSLLLHTPPCPHLQRGIHSQQAARLAQSRPESGQWRSLSAFSPGRTLWVGGVAQEQGRGSVLSHREQIAWLSEFAWHLVWLCLPQGGCAGSSSSSFGPRPKHRHGVDPFIPHKNFSLSLRKDSLVSETDFKPWPCDLVQPINSLSLGSLFVKWKEY